LQYWLTLAAVNPFKMKLRSILLLAVVTMAATSCMSLALSVMGINKKEATLSQYTNGDKTVAYIPMKHIGPKEFYANVKYKVDSLEREGYIVFVESVRVTDSLTQPQKDTLKWKVRKLTGVTIRKEGYIDTINNKLMGRNFKNRRGLVNQPKYSLLGVDSISSRIVDVPMNMLIKQYERDYGAIQLNVCDYTTTFEEKYDCGKEKTSQSNSIILKYRNKHLADEIVAEKHKKIVVLYGSAHENGLFADLKKIDSTWTSIPKKIICTIIL
jgi:hypothetical protein